MRELYLNIISITVGAAIGTSSRYLITLLFIDMDYPYSTIIVNLLGSFLLGFLTAWFLIKIPREWLKVGLGVGLCGSFTTMSTFAADATLLFGLSSAFEAATYVFGSLLGGIILAFLGFISGTTYAKRQNEKR